MRLPRWLYEKLPYLYMGLSLYLILVFSDNNNILAFACILYIAGNAVWIMRSNARRKDRRENRIFLSRMRQQSERFYYPQWFYEEQPFIYLGAGVICIVVMNNIIGLISGGLLIGCSLIVLHLRTRSRSTTRATP